MKWNRLLFCACAGMVLAATGLFAAGVTNELVTSPPVYVPDVTHANQPLPDGVLAWNGLLQTTNAAADQEAVRFTFSFTNVATRQVVTEMSNVSLNADFVNETNVTAITNSEPVSVTILGAHASCGCTQPELPPLPWIIPAGGTGHFSATVNLEARSGVLFKSVTVTTDKGFKELWMRITVLPPVIPTLTAAERARDVELAKVDRQAVFKSDCATCHAKPARGKYGQPLYVAVCAICHEGPQRASFVPDLHHLKVPTNGDFWRTWIAHGKPGTLMPAFSTTEGGPLTDMQIATIAAYLNMAIPSRPAPALVTPPAQK
jgi:mono/diheme cytochrome c family protein